MGSCGSLCASYNHAIIQLNYSHGYTDLWIHSYSDISLGSMHEYYAVNITANNANFVHQEPYLCESVVCSHPPVGFDTTT